MRFCVVSEATVPEESVSLLSEASRRRSIPFAQIEAKSFDFDPAQRLNAGDLLYCAGVSTASRRVEQFLFTPGVATFYKQPGQVYWGLHTHTLLAESAGIPMPKTVYLSSSNRSLVRKQAERVGGFPVVVKILGRSSGIGAMLAESPASLQSLVDFVLAQGHSPLVCQFIPDAVHWRVVVLGSGAVATYRNKRVAGDFRSCGSTHPEDLHASPPPLVVETAVRATAAYQLDFAGVDVLEDASGRVWFLEANFPCYYAHAQLHGGTDIAGAMVDFLADKAAR
jgi:D-alanine-D-alanine ligase-like ATP-grasp enzyme